MQPCRAEPLSPIFCFPSTSIITLSLGFQDKPHFTKQLCSNDTLAPKGGATMFLVEVRMYESSGCGWAGLVSEQRTNLNIAVSPNTNSHPWRQDSNDWSTWCIFPCFAPVSGLSPVVVLIFLKECEWMLEEPHLSMARGEKKLDK